MKKNKGNGILIALIVILTIMVLGLGSYIVYDKFLRPTESTEKSTKKSEEKEESILENENKSIVYSNENYKYLSVPYINLKTIDGIRFNKEIKEFVSDYEDTKEATENFNITYDTFENDNIISVLITKTTPGSSRYMMTVNFDNETGKEITNKDLLEKKNIKEDELSGRLFEAYENQMTKQESLDAVKKNHIYGDEFTSVYDGTKNKIDNTKLNDFEMYLNNNNELVVVADVYFLAGPEGGYVRLNLDTNSYEQ